MRETGAQRARQVPVLLCWDGLRVVPPRRERLHHRNAVYFERGGFCGALRRTVLEARFHKPPVAWFLECGGSHDIVHKVFFPRIKQGDLGGSAVVKLVGCAVLGASGLKLKNVVHLPRIDRRIQREDWRLNVGIACVGENALPLQLWRCRGNAASVHTTGRIHGADDVIGSDGIVGGGTVNDSDDTIDSEERIGYTGQAHEVTRRTHRKG